MNRPRWAAAAGTSALTVFLTWCAGLGLDTLVAGRADLERYVRWLQETRRFKPSTVSRRVSVVAGFYRTCVIDGLLDHSPAEHLRRDAWMLMAARWPEVIPALMADKVAQLANPKIVRLYQLIGRIAENWEDEELLRETADLISELLEQAADSGELDRQDEYMPDAAFIRLMDSFADASHPAVARLRELIAERGWTGWTRVEKREP